MDAREAAEAEARTQPAAAYAAGHTAVRSSAGVGVEADVAVPACAAVVVAAASAGRQGAAAAGAGAAARRTVEVAENLLQVCTNNRTRVSQQQRQ